MPEKAKRPNEEVYVSGFFAERIEEIPGTQRQTLHRVGHANEFLTRKGELVHFEAELYFSLYFRNTRPGVHTGRVVLRDANGKEGPWAEFDPIEQAKHDDISLRGVTCGFDFPRAMHYVCLEVDGVERWRTPVDGAQAART